MNFIRRSLFVVVGVAVMSAAAIATAQPTLKERAEAGQSLAQYEYGYNLLLQGNKKQALKYLERAGEQNNKDAQLQLGNIYYAGVGKSRKKGDLAKAQQWYTRAADNGDREAMYRLALMYYYHVGANADFQKARTLLEASAAKGYPEADFLLGYMHYFGVGDIPRNIKLAITHFATAAECGILDAQYFLGLINYYSAKKNPEAEKWFSRAAAQGYSEAQKDLARLYYYSAEGPAAKWYQRAYAQGDREAAYQLASMYYWGYTVPQNYDSAKAIYLQLAKENDANALLHMGEMSYRGAGVEQNFQVAMEYFQEAATKGNIRAQSYLGELYGQAKGTGASLKKARFWYEDAAHKGDAEAQYELGLIYEMGLGTRKNADRAVGLFKMASMQGNPAAEYYRANLLLQMPQKNIDTAIALYRTAAKKRYVPAMVALAKIHYFGLWGQPKNYIKARDYFVRANEVGDIESMRYLGLIYYYGQGVGRNLHTASDYFYHAAQQGDDTAQYYCGLMRSHELAALDGSSAREWFSKAAAQGNSDALLELGKLYLYGINGEYRDLARAKDYFKQAMKAGNPLAAELLDQAKNDKVQPPARIEWGDKVEVVEVVEPEVSVSLKILSKSPINDAKFYLNGQQLADSNILFHNTTQIQQNGSQQVTLKLHLIEGDNRVVAQVTNGSGRQTEQGKTVRRALSATEQLSSETRIALVIGNAEYEEGDMKLGRTRNDANDVAAMLEEELGFEVVKAIDLTREGMLEKIAQFRESSYNRDVVMVYYSGHGIGTDGGNYLVPINAQLNNLTDVELQCINLNSIINCIDEATRYNPNSRAIIVLDACRNNPFGQENNRTGMQNVQPTRGMCILYAAGYGQVAYENNQMDKPTSRENRNSVFTRELLRLLDQPIPFNELTQQLSDNVFNTTNHVQQPHVEGSLPNGNTFFLKRQ